MARPNRAQPPKRGRAPSSRRTRSNLQARSGVRRSAGSPRSTSGNQNRPRDISGLGGDQIEGINAVRECLIVGKRRIRELLVSIEATSQDVMSIIELAESRRVEVKVIGRGALDERAHSANPQGIIARVEPLAGQDLDSLASSARVLLVLDGVTDPVNLGAIARSAACLGVVGLVIGKHRTARFTASACKAAAGAVEHLSFSQVGGVPSAIADLKRTGFMCIGLDESAPGDIYSLDVNGDRLAIVMGSEGKGLSRLTKERCDVLTRIPMSSRLDSLNVSVAAGIACSVLGQRLG